MLAITLNPGFAFVIGALIALGVPAALRSATMAASAAAAMWLLLDHEFGAAEAVRQVGLPVVLLRLDALNQVFGIAFIAGAMLLAIYTGARRSRYEDAAILLLAGGVVSALFVGDMVSFVAAASLAGLAAVWVVFASPQQGANSVGVRLLIWHGLEGLLFLAGVAFQLSAGADPSVLGRLNVESIGGGFIFAALMIRVGAPLAHVWLKDATSHASGAGAAAISMFSTLFGVYALARLFPGEPLLAPIGLAMIVLGALFAAAEDDLRRAAGYGLTAQTGVCVALIGLGSPLAHAAAVAHAFTTMFAFGLLQMALGGVLFRIGAPRASGLAGLARAMPVTAFFVVLGGAAAAGAPGLGAYVSLAAGLDAAAQWPTRLIWLGFAGLSGVLMAALAIRPALIAFRGAGARAQIKESPFPMLLGMVLGAFFCVAVGLAPAWLYRLTPPNGVDFAPYAPGRLGPHLALIGAAGSAYVMFWVLRLAPRERPLELLDFDALYRGPVAGAGRWTGVVILRIFGALQAIWSRLAARGAEMFGAWVRACDRPYIDRWSGVAQFAAIGAVLVIILWARH